MTDTRSRRSTSDARSGRRRARKGEGELLRDEILDAAEALLMDAGHKDAVTIRAVAQRVGVSTPSIYLHFADKDELFYRTCRRAFDGLNQALVEAFAAGGTVVERMLRAGRAYIAFGLSHPGQYAVMFGMGTQDGVPDEQLDDDPGVHAFELLVGLIRSGVESGEFRPDLDVDATAVAVWSAVHGTCNILISKRGMEHALDIPPDEKVIDAALTMVLEGLRPRAER
jgi:AcrR family transcriptional regulator